MTDFLKPALWIGLGALVVSIGCLATVAWANASSRNLVLATSTLLGAALLFVSQLPFELRTKTEADIFAAELTIDRSVPMIRQWKYPDFPDTSGWRLGRESDASAFLANKDPKRFDEEPERVSADLVLFSLLAFLGSEQFDWQLKRTALRGTTFGEEIRTQRVSREDECTWYTAPQLEEKLVSAGNLFAGTSLWITGGKLCLPLGSELSLTSRSLVIATPHCTLSFHVEPSGSVSYVKPSTGGETPQIRPGLSQYETRLTGIRSEVTFSWARAQSPDAEKYAAWTNRLVKSARLWFEGRSSRSE